MGQAKLEEALYAPSLGLDDVELDVQMVFDTPEDNEKRVDFSAGLLLLLDASVDPPVKHHLLEGLPLGLGDSLPCQLEELGGLK